MVKVLYILDGALLGEAQIEVAEDTWLDSIAYFCATCGDIWGRVIVTNAIGTTNHWRINTCPCRKHQRSSVRDWSSIPGTITSAFLQQVYLSKMEWAVALENLPHAVLTREFHLLLDHFERQQND